MERKTYDEWNNMSWDEEGEYADSVIRWLDRKGKISRQQCKAHRGA